MWTRAQRCDDRRTFDNEVSLNYFSFHHEINFIRHVNVGLHSWWKYKISKLILINNHIIHFLGICSTIIPDDLKLTLCYCPGFQTLSTKPLDVVYAVIGELTADFTFEVILQRSETVNGFVFVDYIYEESLYVSIRIQEFSYHRFWNHVFVRVA